MSPVICHLALRMKLSHAGEDREYGSRYFYGTVKLWHMGTRPLDLESYCDTPTWHIDVGLRSYYVDWCNSCYHIFITESNRVWT